jgi:hypothetical protein
MVIAGMAVAGRHPVADRRQPEAARQQLVRARRDGRRRPDRRRGLLARRGGTVNLTEKDSNDSKTTV